VISFVMKYHGLSQHDACAWLGGKATLNTVAKRVQPRHEQHIELTEPPSAEWQGHALQVIEWAQMQLLDGDPRGLDYLYKRGLDDTTIGMARLGYIPARDEQERQYGRIIDTRWRKDDGKPVRVPCGVVIPHYEQGLVWNIRVRRSVEPKYMGVAGGARCLYLSRHIQPGLPVLVCEGEFDALIAWQAAGDLISPVALASASNAQINPRWYPALIGAPLILARMDEDAAGAKALAKLRAISQVVQPVTVPVGKDINDFYREVGEDVFRQWIMEVSK
jgi:DNA primase